MKNNDVENWSLPNNQSKALDMMSREERESLVSYLALSYSKRISLNDKLFSGVILTPEEKSMIDAKDKFEYLCKKHSD